MKRGFLVALLMSSTALSANVNELLYVKKNKSLNFQKKKTRKVRNIQIYKHLKRSIKKIETVRKEMIASGEYEYVEYNSQQYPAIQSNSFSISNTPNWHSENINAVEALELIQSPQEVVVAVCDSGYDENHPELRGGSVNGYNFVGNNYDTQPNTHHGTMVSGLIVGKQSESGNTMGIAPYVKVMPLKITTSKGSASLSRIVECIKYGADNGAKVINVSFTGVNNNSIEEAGKYARSKGALLVYSAGNHGKNRGSWPDHKNVLIVGGTQESNNRWNCSKWYKKCGSNYGHFIDIVAPARNIYTTRASSVFGGNDYSSPNGTSFSAPIISAVAALVYSVNPDFSAEQVERILLESARQKNNTYVYGSGIVDAKKAVELAMSY